MKKNLVEVVRFGVVGVIAVAIHYGVYLLLSCCMNVTIAYAFGYLVSFICNFYLSNVFTFRTKPTVKKGLGFIGCHVINFCAQLLMFRLLLWMGIPETLIPIGVFIVVVPSNFLLVRYVFKSKQF